MFLNLQNYKLNNYLLNDSFIYQVFCYSNTDYNIPAQGSLTFFCVIKAYGID